MQRNHLGMKLYFNFINTISKNVLQKRISKNKERWHMLSLDLFRRMELVIMCICPRLFYIVCLFHLKFSPWFFVKLNILNMPFIWDKLSVALLCTHWKHLGPLEHGITRSILFCIPNTAYRDVVQLQWLWIYSRLGWHWVDHCCAFWHALLFSISENCCPYSWRGELGEGGILQ